MRKQALTAILAVSLIAAPAAFTYAEETELTEAAALTLEAEDVSYELSDETSVGIVSIAAEEDTESEDEGLLSVTLTDAEGETHEINGVDLSGVADLSAVERLGFVYLTGTDAEGKAVYFAEEAEETELDESETMYTISRVNIREDADPEAEVVVVAEVNTEVEVLGGTAEWYHVKSGEDEGYIAQQYLTFDAEEAQAAQQKAEEEAAAAAAAQAEAEAAAAASGSASSGSSAGGDACLTGGVLS